MSQNIGRRRFLEHVGGGALGLLAAGYAGTARGYLANETINVGCIGTGGRCRWQMARLAKIPGVKIAAVCDIWDDNLEAGRKLADPQAMTFTDYHELLARKDIDAVLIGSPDHWHVPMTIDACAAGKDVYVEKPLTHNLAEGAAVIEAQNKHQRIVQVGTQQRSVPHLQKAREIIQSGQIGEVYKVHMTWNRNAERWNRGPAAGTGPVDPARWKQFLGNAPDQPYDDYKRRNWRWFWDFGGGIFTDLMVHFVDVAHWCLDLGSPATATSIGDHFKAKDVWETPDTVQTLLRYPDKNVQVYFEGTFVNARNAAMIEFMGTEATLYADRGRYEVIPERRSKLAASELVVGKGPRGADFYEEVDCGMHHLVNWIESVRSRQKPNCPAEVGVQAAAAAHLANESYRTGQVARQKG